MRDARKDIIRIPVEANKKYLETETLQKIHTQFLSSTTTKVARTAKARDRRRLLIFPIKGNKRKRVLPKRGHPKEELSLGFIQFVD